MLKTIGTALVLLMALATLGQPLLAEELALIKKTQELGEATETEALVYVLRPAFAGKAVKFWTFADDLPIGVTRGKNYAFALVPPGKHVFWARGENVSALELEVEAGETYYLQQKVRMGGLKARVSLVQVDASEGQALMKECKYSVLTDEGRSRAVEIAAEKLAVAKEKAAQRAERLEEEEEEE